MTDRVELPGSHRDPLDDAEVIGPPDHPEIHATIVLKDDVGGRIGALEQLADAHDLSLERTGRLVRVHGAPDDMAEAFGTKLELVDHPKLGRFRARTGTLEVSQDVADIVEAVLGLDDRPVASTHLRLRPRASGGYAPVQVAQAYGFPTDVKGHGVTVGVIELGGAFGQGDLSAYWSEMGVSPAPSVVAVGVDGAGPASDGANGADGEVMLDVEVVGAIAPGAVQRVYFAPNTDAGFIDAIHRAAQECQVVSISWGAAEPDWTAASMKAYDKVFADARAAGVVISAAAGDNGSGDGVGDGKSHTDFPASSPNVLACGGTTLKASGATINSEVVWNVNPSNDATGGGVSSTFGVPAYQSALGSTLPVQAETHKAGRVVPDVAGNADPNTGWRVRVDGQEFAIGGTSAVAPMWAALVALLIERGGGQRLPNFHDLLYGKVGVMRDITKGDNGAYAASKGFDACTGLGSPRPERIIAALADAGGGGGTPTPPPSAGLQKLITRLQRNDTRGQGARLNHDEVDLVVKALA